MTSTIITNTISMLNTLRPAIFETILLTPHPRGNIPSDLSSLAAHKIERRQSAIVDDFLFCLSLSCSVLCLTSSRVGGAL